MKTRLRFLSFYDCEEFGDGKHGYIEKDFDTKQEAFDYLCYFAVCIDIATIQEWGSAVVDSYDCEDGFLKELIKKQKNSLIKGDYKNE